MPRPALALLALLLLLPVGPAAAQEDGKAEAGVGQPSNPAAAAHPLNVFAIEHSQQLYPPDQGGFAHAGAAPFVVLARLDVYADSLAASVLLRDAPLLFTDGEVLDPPVGDEVDRLMPDGGRVLVLGGEAAIGQDVLDALAERGHAPERVAGSSRVETALAIADLFVELGGSAGSIALARAGGPEATAEWADAIAAAPWSASTGTPVLLTPTDGLHPAVQAWLADNGVERTVLLGGEAALSAAVAEAVPGPERYEGPNRFATAVEISEELHVFSRYRFRIVAADHPDGWGYALAGSGMAVEERAAVLLTYGDRVPAETEARTCARDRRAPIEVFGGPEVIGQDVRDQLESDCG